MQVDLDGLRIAYERAGTGSPLILLHGGFGLDSRSWRRQIEGLSDRFDVVAWDGPGCGRSADPPEGFGVGGYADCLAAFVGRLGLGRPHVLGLSFGAALALELYRRHPRDVLRRVAVPTLLLYGDADRRSPLSIGEALHTAIPGSQLAVLPGVGHLSNIEAAAKFNDEVRRFLSAQDERVPPGSERHGRTE